MTAASNEVAVSVERLTEVMRLVEYDMMHRHCDGDGFVGERKEVATIITALRHRIAHSDPRPVAEGLRKALRASLAKRSVPTMDPVWSAAFNAALDMVERDTRAALATHSPAPMAGEVERLHDALVDLVSWFPENGPSVYGPWIIKAGPNGADDAIYAARAAAHPSTQEGSK